MEKPRESLPGASRARPAEEATPVRFAVALMLPEVDSTNRLVSDRARDGEAEGFVAVAELQTAGRGRLGRRWEAPAGSSILASLLFRPPALDAAVHLLPAVVALAARDACRQVAGVEPVLKWPNDLLVDGRKLAGILAEVVPEAPAVVVGIGINVNWPDRWPPRDLAGATALNRVAGAPVDREALLEALLAGVTDRYAGLAEDPGAQLAAYRGACATIGSEVRVELAGERFVGTATGLSDSCELVVATVSGMRVVSAGDVVHLRAADLPPPSG